MCSLFKAIVCTALLGGSLSAAALPPLQVCADTNDLPFSNSRGQGFENVLAKMVAKDLQRDVHFVWVSQQAPYAAKRTEEQSCDLLMAITGPGGLMVPTIPYYRSSYVFVARRDRHIHVARLDDQRLANYRIGAQTIGDDDASSPAAEELARRGLGRNIVGYSIYGYPLGRNPSEQLVCAVEQGRVDLAVVWGPAAGYFAGLSPVPLEVMRIIPPRSSALPVAFDISMGVRRDNSALLGQLNDFIRRRHKEISEVLERYGVPLLGTPAVQRVDYPKR